MDASELVNLARGALEFSYSPYSNYRVGAALLAADGSVITGTNIENASLGLTICAERTAIFKAVSQGIREFTSLAVIADTPTLALPCGACRQVMAEFNPDLELVLANLRGGFRVFSLRTLLPHPFLPDSLSSRPRVMTTRLPARQYSTSMNPPDPEGADPAAGDA